MLQVNPSRVFALQKQSLPGKLVSILMFCYGLNFIALKFFFFFFFFFFSDLCDKIYFLEEFITNNIMKNMFYLFIIVTEI